MINTRIRTETRTFKENLGNGTTKVTTKKAEVHYVTVGDIVGAVNNASDALKKLKQHASDINLRQSVVGAFISPLLALASAVNIFKKVNQVMEIVTPIAQLAARVSGLFFSPGNTADIAQIVLGTVEKIIIQLVTAGFIKLKNWVWNHEFIIKTIESEVSTTISVAIEDVADKLLKAMEEATQTISNPSEDTSLRKLREELETENIGGDDYDKDGNPKWTDDETETIMTDDEGSPITTPKDKKLKYYFAKKFNKPAEEYEVIPNPDKPDEKETKTISTTSILGSAADEGLWYLNEKENKWEQSNITTGNWKSCDKFSINFNAPAYAQGIRTDVYVASAYPTWKLCESEKFANTEARPRYGKINKGIVQFITAINPVNFYKKASSLSGEIFTYNITTSKFEALQESKYYYYDSSSNKIVQKTGNSFDPDIKYYTIGEEYTELSGGENPAAAHKWYDKILKPADDSIDKSKLYYYEEEYKQLNKTSYAFSTKWYVDNSYVLQENPVNPKEASLYRFKDAIIYNDKEYLEVSIDSDSFNKDNLYERLNYRQVDNNKILTTPAGYYELKIDKGEKYLVQTTDTEVQEGKKYFEKIEAYEFFKTNDTSFIKNSIYYKLTTDVKVDIEKLIPTEDTVPQVGALYFKYEAGAKKKATEEDRKDFEEWTKNFYVLTKTVKKLEGDKVEGTQYYYYAPSEELTSDDTDDYYFKVEGLIDKNKKIAKFVKLTEYNFPAGLRNDIYIYKEEDGVKHFIGIDAVDWSSDDWADTIFNKEALDIDNADYYIKTYPHYITNLVAAAADESYFVKNTDVHFTGSDDYYTDNTLFNFDKETGKVIIKDSLYEIEADGQGLVYSTDYGRTWTDTNIDSGNFSLVQFVFDNTDITIQSLEPFDYLNAWNSWSEANRPHTEKDIVSATDGSNYEIEVVKGFTPLTCGEQLYVDTGEQTDTGANKFRKVNEDDVFYLVKEENIDKYYHMVDHKYSYTPTIVAASADNEGLWYSLSGLSFEKSNIKKGSFIDKLNTVNGIPYHDVADRSNDPEQVDIINDVDQRWKKGDVVDE